MNKSRGESAAKEGDRFTSNNHGLRLESIRISNPYKSKQLLLYNPCRFTPSTTICSIDMRDFMITSHILLQSKFVSTPTL